MSVDWDDYGRDEYELEVANRAIEEFQTERLQSFYRDHPDLALKPIHLVKEARSALAESPSAALVLATASMEVGFKSMILGPIISGLVHEESLASLVTEVFVTSAKQDGVRRIVHQVLKKYASIDLEQITLPQHNKPYWMEVSEAQGLRNGVLHRAEACSMQDAKVVLELAEYLWNVVFLAVIKNFGLHTHDSQTICGQHELFCKNRALIEKVVKTAS